MDARGNSQKACRQSTKSQKSLQKYFHKKKEKKTKAKRLFDENKLSTL